MADLERAVARMFCIGFSGTSVPGDMRDLIARGVGGAVLFRRNFSTAAQFIELCGELKTIADRPFLTSIDHEGGRVTRLGPPFTPIPSMRSIGESNDPHLARSIGQIMARELRAANIDLNFAPVMDVDTNPLNPVIADRSFGRSPEQVSQMGLALIDGLQSEGVAACAKHFPGHGDTSQDSHHELPHLTHALPRLNEIELPPFTAAARAGVAAIMTAHIIFDAIDPTFPATMSRAVITGLLREKMQFDGVIISDDVEMKAIAAHFRIEEVVIRAVNAGVDMLLICHTPALQNAAIDALISAVERGDVSRAVIERSSQRLDRLFSRFVRSPSINQRALIGCEAHRRLTPAASTACLIDPTDPMPK